MFSLEIILQYLQDVQRKERKFPSPGFAYLCLESVMCLRTTDFNPRSSEVPSLFSNFKGRREMLLVRDSYSPPPHLSATNLWFVCSFTKFFFLLILEIGKGPCLLVQTKHLCLRDTSYHLLKGFDGQASYQLFLLWLQAPAPLQLLPVSTDTISS